MTRDLAAYSVRRHRHGLDRPEARSEPTPSRKPTPSSPRAERLPNCPLGAGARARPATSFRRRGRRRSPPSLSGRSQRRCGYRRSPCVSCPGNGQDSVAGLQSRRFRRGVGTTAPTTLVGGSAPRRMQEGGEDHDREQEIGHRAGQDDEEALPHRPQLEGPVAQFRRDMVEVAGIARRAHVADELHIAAERQPGDLPARALAVGPAEQLAAEADREDLRRDAEQAGDEIMAELVEEDERPERAARRRPGSARAAAAEASVARPPSSRASTRERVARSISSTSSIESGSGKVRARSASSTIAAISRKPIRPARKAATATSLAALRTIGAAPPASSASPREPKRGEACEVRRLEIEPARSRRGRAAAPASPSARARRAHRRSGCACRARRAAPAPSRRRYSTSEWITDCGWMRTSIRVGRQAEQMMRLDQLEPLVHQRRRIDRDLRAHRPVGMRDRLRRRGRGDLLGRAGAERAAARGQDDLCRRRPRGRRQDIGRSHYARCRPAAGRAARLAPPDHQLAGRDQRLLVGERDRLARVDRRHRRPQPGAADDRGHRPGRRRPPRPRPDRLVARRGPAAGAGKQLRRRLAGALRRRSPRAARRSAAQCRPAPRRCVAAVTATTSKRSGMRSIRSSVDLPTDPVAPRIAILRVTSAPVAAPRQ